MSRRCSATAHRRSGLAAQPAVLQAAGREDIPVAVGMGMRMSGELPELLRQAYAGDRGRPDRITLPDQALPVTRLHAVDLLIVTVRGDPGEVTIIASGPQTNLALALLKEPRLREEIASIVFMGGALGLEPKFGRGSITPSPNATSGSTLRQLTSCFAPASTSRW